MGGRGSSSSGSSASAGGMTDRQLNSSISGIRNEMDKVGARMEQAAYKIESAQASSREGRQERVSKARREYNSLSDRYNGLRDRLTKLESERDKRASSITTGNQSRVRVNSFGEATTRYITSPSYERAQRSQEKRIRSLLGR